MASKGVATERRTREGVAAVYKLYQNADGGCDSVDGDEDRTEKQSKVLDGSMVLYDGREAEI